MRWSKVRKLVHESFADSVRDRVRIDVTNADPRGVRWQDTCKLGTITVDRHVVAHIDPHRLRKLTLSLPAIAPLTGKRQTVLIVETRFEQRVPAGAEYGEFLDLPQACWQYLQSSLNESLDSADPFVSSLAVLNSKVGMQRLRRLQLRELHPLTRAMVDFRISAGQESRARVTRIAPRKPSVAVVQRSANPRGSASPARAPHLPPATP